MCVEYAVGMDHLAQDVKTQKLAIIARIVPWKIQPCVKYHKKTRIVLATV